MSYRVELPVFCGPMDLLLHLVKQQEVDIHEVSIARILHQYLGYLKVLEELDLADLGDFLVMASTLMEIKSREMLPGVEVEIDRELDPRDDLIRRLIEYKRYRDISRRLDRYAKLRSRMVEASVALPGEVLAEQQRIAQEEELLDVGEIEIWSLTAAFARLLEEIGHSKESLNIGIDKRGVRHYTTRVLERVRDGRERRFEELLDPSEGRHGLVGAFVAILEMMKQGVLRAFHRDGDGDIVVTFCGARDLTVDAILAGGERVDVTADGQPEAAESGAEPSPGSGG